MQSVHIELPEPVFERLRTFAEQQQRSIPDTVDALIEQATPPSLLEKSIEHEITALSSLPNEVLLLVIQNPMPQADQEELALLNDKAQRTGSLSQQEENRQRELHNYQQNAILRRSYCLEILRRRGYDVSTILQMPQPIVL